MHNERVKWVLGRNTRREQGRSILLLLSLIATVLSLACWAARLIYGWFTVGERRDEAPISIAFTQNLGREPGGA